jgi:dipeptidase D
LLKDVYVATFGHDAEVKATHGGLECGIIMGAYPALDAISFGPTLHFPHSPDEHIEIDSVGRFWKFLVKVLEGIPTR